MLPGLISYGPIMKAVATVAVSVLALAQPGCAPAAMDGGFESGNPSARVYAAERAAETGDRTAIPHLIEMLDSDDPAERFVAIGALERLTGHTLGYGYADPPAQRREAVKRWVDSAEEVSTAAAERNRG